MIEYSPYDVKISEKNINSENIQSLSQQDDTAVFVVISDTHSYYDHFTDAVKYINKMEDVDFVVVCGDITDSGLSTEFEWYLRIAKRLKVPFITLKGNHDCRSNGEIVYREMFGLSDFRFDYGKYKFICFDDVVWEKNNATPDFAWLTSALAAENANVSQPVVLFSHISYTSDQLQVEKGLLMKSIIFDSPVLACFNGHDHHYEYREENHKKFITVAAINRRELIKVQLVDTSLTFNRYNF